MTGLDPTADRIVEIATLITDDDLAIVAEGPDLIVHQPPDQLARMEPVVRAMHTKSGLLPRGIEASTLTPRGGGPADPSSSAGPTSPSRARSPCAATPSAPTGGSWRHGCPRSRPTSTTARSTSPRSKSWPGAGTRGCWPAPRGRSEHTACSTTSGRASKSSATTAATSSCRRRADRQAAMQWLRSRLHSGR